MNTQYLFEVSPRLGVAVLEGQGSIGEVLETMKNVANDPRFHPEDPLLVDAGNLTFRMSAKDAQTIAVTLNTLKAEFRGRIAVLVTADGLYGMVRMVSLLMDIGGFAIRAFRDSAAAREWLLEKDSGAGNPVSQI